MSWSYKIHLPKGTWFPQFILLRLYQLCRQQYRMPVLGFRLEGGHIVVSFSDLYGSVAFVGCTCQPFRMTPASMHRCVGDHGAVWSPLEGQRHRQCCGPVWQYQCADVPFAQGKHIGFFNCSSGTIPKFSLLYSSALKSSFTNATTSAWTTSSLPPEINSATLIGPTDFSARCRKNRVGCEI